MPKDNIDDIVIGGYRAEVVWTPGCDVQIATVNQRSALTLPGEKRAEDDAPAPEPFFGWYVTLDRSGCNRLIRSLRKARDAAFGADA